MEKETILQSNVLDIIFEHRNKSYGAYALRKFYDNRLYKSLALVFGLAALFAAYNLLYTEKASLNTKIYGDDPAPKKRWEDPAPKKPKENTYHQPMTAAVAVKTPSLAHPIITKDSVDIRPVSTVPTNPGPSTAAVNQGGTGDPGTVPVVGGQPDPIPSTPPIPEIDRNKPMEFAEVMPSFPGGQDALRRFLERNLRNPQDMEAGQTITVKVRFVVSFDGTLKKFETVEDGGEAYNNEVMRVLKKMPQWNPGKTKGENVSVYFILPVRFTASE